MTQTISDKMDRVHDEIVKMQATGINPSHPSHILIGKQEFMELFADRYNKMEIPSPDGESTLWGLNVVLDIVAETRMDVMPEASFRTYRKMFR